MLPKEMFTLRNYSKVFLPLNKANSTKSDLFFQNFPRTFSRTFIALTLHGHYAPHF